MISPRFPGSSALYQLRNAAVLARLGSNPNPPRIAITLAKMAALAAIGGVAAVLAMPLLAMVDALTH